jgi:hypothetical protein
MTCGLCKQPIRGDEWHVTDHYQCLADLHQSFRDDVAKAESRVTTLLAGLRTYGQHKNDCHIYGPKHGIGTAKGICTCGFEALITAQERTE